MAQSSEVVSSSQSERPSPRLAILTNILAPYRMPIFRHLGNEFDTLILLAGNEDNRSWNVSHASEAFKVKTSWGVTLKRRLRTDCGSIKDLQYIHANPGYLVDLVRFRPDAIISSQMGFGSLIALTYGRLRRIPVWIWWGGTVHTERNRSWAKRLMRRYFFAKLAPRWISYGASSTEYLRTLGVAQERILQVQNAVDDTLFTRAVPPFELSVPRPRILFVGQMIGRKGLDQLLSAAATLQREGLRFSLVLIGHGPESEQIETDARESELTSLCIPFVDSHNMPSVYRACDALVFPTLEDVWGLVVNEALLSGLPVIASCYAGCARELLPESNIFDPLNHEEFVSLLRRAVTGKLPPADPAPVKPIREVAEMIAIDIWNQLGAGRRSS